VKGALLIFAAVLGCKNDQGDSRPPDTAAVAEVTSAAGAPGGSSTQPLDSSTPEPAGVGAALPLALELLDRSKQSPLHCPELRADAPAEAAALLKPALDDCNEAKRALRDCGSSQLRLDAAQSASLCPPRAGNAPPELRAVFDDLREQCVTAKSMLGLCVRVPLSVEEPLTGVHLRIRNASDISFDSLSTQRVQFGPLRAHATSPYHELRGKTFRYGAVRARSGKREYVKLPVGANGGGPFEPGYYTWTLKMSGQDLVQELPAGYSKDSPPR
jgi:hypothetical protein